MRKNSKLKVKTKSLKFLVLSFSFALCTLSFTLITSCAKREIKNIDSPGKNIICFGDSITFGSGVKAGEGYPSILAQMIGRAVVNAGIDNDTSEEALKRLKSDVIDKEPLLVIIEIGGNDFLRRFPLEQTVRNVEEMIKEIQGKGAMVALADISLSGITPDYDKEFERLSEKYACIFIRRLLEGILTNPTLKSDFLHPNTQGYKVISHRVYRAILPYLNQNAILKRLRR